MTYIEVILWGNRLRSFPKLENASQILIQVSVYIKAKNTNLHTYFPKSRSGKHFQASEMRAIDFSHKIMGHF